MRANKNIDILDKDLFDRVDVFTFIKIETWLLMKWIFFFWFFRPHNTSEKFVDTYLTPKNVQKKSNIILGKLHNASTTTDKVCHILARIYYL